MVCFPCVSVSGLAGGRMCSIPWRTARTVFLMMNTWCSKHAEDTKNWIKALILKHVRYVGIHNITLQNFNPDYHNKNKHVSKTQHVSPHSSLWGRQPSTRPEDVGTHICTEHEQPPTRLYTINPQDHSKNSRCLAQQNTFHHTSVSVWSADFPAPLPWTRTTSLRAVAAPWRNSQLGWNRSWHSWSQKFSNGQSTACIHTNLRCEFRNTGPTNI